MTSSSTADAEPPPRGHLGEQVRHVVGLSGRGHHVAPAAASASTRSCPIPREAPVTSAT